MADKLKILVLEDLATDAELLIDELQLAAIDFDYQIVDNESRFREALISFQPDLVFSDFSLPTINGLEAIALVKEYDPYLPVIIVTGSINEETAVECMKAGAVDYVLKEKLKRLAPAAEAAIKNARLASERETMASKIREMEASLRLSFNHAAIGMLLITPEGSFITCNQAFEQLTGYSEDELLERSIQDITHPEDYEIDAATIQQILSGKKSTGIIEKRYIHKNGHTIWVRLSTSLIRDADGKPLHFFIQAEDTTSQKKASEELQRAQAEAQRIQDIFKKAIENAAGVPYLLNTDSGEYEFVGSEIHKLLGLTPGQLNRQSMRKMVKEIIITDSSSNGSDPDEYAHSFNSGMQSRYKADFRVQLPDGTEKWVSDSAVPVSNDDGKVTHSLGILMDITDRKQAELKLAERERYFRTLLNQLHEDVIVIDSNYKITDMNNSFLITLGKKREAVIGKYCFQVAHGYNQACDLNGEICELKKVFKTGMPSSCIHQHQHKNGKMQWVDILLSPIKDEQGKVVKVIESARNISDLMQAHNELRKQTTAIEQSPVSVMMTDLDGNIEYVNPKFCEVTGYNRDEVLGKNPRILKSGEQDQAFYKELWETITAGKIWRGRMHNRARNGELFWEDATIGPVLDDSGKITHFLGLKEDITAQLQLEEQLQQSQKLEAIGQLAGGVAHDFNNLLTIINGYSELMRTKIADDSPLHSDIEQITRAGERASSLTQQLLAFSRKQVIKPKVLNLNHLIKETDKMLRRLIGEDIILELDLEEQLPAINADPGQLDQVLLNLAVNARDAMPNGGRLIIKTGKLNVTDSSNADQEFYVKPGEYVSLCVRDTGLGMDEDTRKRIFEPFFTTKGQGKGTGLGLATVYGIVKQSEGYIQVNSTPGMGTTFDITLPVVEPVREEVRQTGISPADLSGSETVLIVEDEPEVRRLIKETLEAKGYKVLQADSGTEALHILDKSQSVDMVLTDVIMPGMSGKALSDQIKSIAPGIKVIYVSGYTDDAISRVGVLDEGVLLLQKPFSAQNLLSIIRQAFDDRP